MKKFLLEIWHKITRKNQFDRIEKAIDNIERTPLTEVELTTFLHASWTQKQLDDLLLANQSVMNSLKTQPFNQKYLEKRDRIHHDINMIQPIVLSTGLACAAIIEKKYGVEFVFLTGRHKPIPKQEDAAPEKGKSVEIITPTPKIILPGQ